MELLGNVKNYDWGKVGSQSKVAQLAQLNAGEDFKLDENRAYSELWMGDHVSGPSSVKVTGALLSDALKGKPTLLCNDTTAQPSLFRLPYLFKVLSVNTALSIQVHPNKSQAEMLHKRYPDVYKDDNHKPELAIALTPFLAMCGFREYHEISAYLEAIAPLRTLIGEENAKALIGADPADGLKRCFTKLMTATEEQIKETLTAVGEIIPSLRDQLVTSTFAKVSAEYPNDVGILSIFFLNILELQPGEAIFLSANEPHAYLSGDCIECMACSDNVIRAGLTPKFKDVDALLEMVNYQTEPKSRKFFEPEICCDGFSKLFIPPVKDFAVKEIRVQSQSAERYQLKNWANGSILLVLQGNAELVLPQEMNLPAVQMQAGSIVFIPSCGVDSAASELKFTFTAAGEGGSEVAAGGGDDDDTFLAYQAFYNEFH